MRKLLPNEQLRPYLPTATKQAWHMDKQSLRGIKRRRSEAAEEDFESELQSKSNADAAFTSDDK